LSKRSTVNIRINLVFFWRLTRWKLMQVNYEK